MSRRTRVLLTSAFAMSLGGFGFAVAQSGGTAAGDPGAGEAGLDVERRANLTPEQQRQEAAEIVDKGNNVSRQVAAMLDEARQERDIIRVTCLNDKLTQINANLRTATTRAEALDDAIESQDAPRRNHEFTVLTVIAQKLQTLEREAQQCIGEDIFETGATTVETEIDDDDPVDPDELPDLPVPVPVLPPPVSPTS